MESHTSVRTVSSLPELWICGPYPGIFTLGINCADVRTTFNVIEVELRDDRLVPTRSQDSVPIQGSETKDASFNWQNLGHVKRSDIENVASSWTLYLSPGRDRHEQNIEVIRSHVTGEVYLRTVRRIQEGEELFVWYSEELARELSIPILTPANVQGNFEYVCSACSSTFQYPNPLKAHIRFHCQSSTKLSTYSPPLDRLSSKTRKGGAEVFPVSSLWSPIKFMDTPIENSDGKCISANRTKPLRFQDEMTRPDFLALNYMNHLLFPPNQHPFSSMFSFRFPFFPGFLPCGVIPPIIPFKDSDHGFPQSAPVSLSGSTISKNSSTEEDVFRPTPVEVELGENVEELPRMIYTTGRKTKRGYLCVYCGKLYSRKYGLKIHVRTHTGFKPLKCKVCLRPFGDPSNLNKHIRLHAEGDTPYRCHHCGKVLVRRRDLERHIRSRHSKEAATYLDTMCDDNVTSVTSSMSLFEEQEADETKDPVDVI